MDKKNSPRVTRSYLKSSSKIAKVPVQINNYGQNLPPVRLPQPAPKEQKPQQSHLKQMYLAVTNQQQNNYYRNMSNSSAGQKQMKNMSNMTLAKIVASSPANYETGKKEQQQQLTKIKVHEPIPADSVAKNLISNRNKNIEAIRDLRQRIPEIENIFDVHARIGNGTFSTVLMGTLKKDRNLPEAVRRKYAIKHHIPTSHPDRIMKELQCMAKIGGKQNVVGINCCIRYNESVAFIMPYLAHDRFHDFYHKMQLEELQMYMKNLLQALAHVHKFNVIHRDVKPSNFLYNRKSKEFLLVDFGLAQHVQPPQMARILETSQTQKLLPISNNSNNNNSEMKRAREQEDGGDAESSNHYKDSNAAKRMRSDALVCATDCQRMSGGGVAASSAASLNNNSSFKMPLKQINEITMQVKVNGVMANASNASALYDPPLTRQVKSAIIGATMSAKLQQEKQRLQTNNNDGSATANDFVVKYNTNRKSINSNSMAVLQQTSCKCYSNPQVCNVCLVKKEIHASRAGTPGYRPPEVLLKYPDQTTAVDVWAAGVIFLSVLSSVYPFFKAPNDFVALAEIITIFGDRNIRKTAFLLDRLVTLNQKSKALDLRKLCVRFRNRPKYSSPLLLKKYQRADGSCDVCKNCDQYSFNCLCMDSPYFTEPISEDGFPESAYDLLNQLLEVNPHKRITAEEALKHPFFSESSSEKLAIAPALESEKKKTFAAVAAKE